MAVAAVATVFQKLTGYDLSTFSLWLVIPAGAIFTGLAASSGYYFGSIYLHTQARWYVALQTVVVAALTYLLIQYLQYYFFTLDGAPVRDRVSFETFEQIALTHQQIHLGRGMMNVGEVGSLGYGLAALDLLGFLAGGVVLYLILRRRATCKTCPRYLHTRAVKHRRFNDFQQASSYYDGLFDKPVNDPAFAAQAVIAGSSAKAKKGAINIKTSIMECPECSRQRWFDAVQMFNGRDWRDIPNTGRAVDIPLGTNMVPFVRAKA